MRFELHCHSTCSDGTDPPARVAERAAEAGVDVFALTDHDTCAGCDAALPAGARAIRGVEVTCEYEGRTVHVLAYRRSADGWAALEERLAAVRVARRNRMRVMAARLVQRGIRIDVEPMIADAEASGRALGRPDLARAMVAIGAATSRDDAFSRHLYDHGPVDVPQRTLPLDEALAIGRAADAAMSLAHPHLYDNRGVSMLTRYRGAGLTGVEAFHGAYDAGTRQRWIDLADRLGLVCTGGTDWHGVSDASSPSASSASPSPSLGVELPASRAEALMRWLALS
jgi:predicted metal-dependent phosphoesterase TrpH